MIEAQCMKTNQNSEDLNGSKKNGLTNIIVSKYPYIKIGLMRPIYAYLSHYCGKIEKTDI